MISDVLAMVSVSARRGAVTGTVIVQMVLMRRVAVSCHMSRDERKPVFEVSNRSDTNWPVQSQKKAGSLKFSI